MLVVSLPCVRLFDLYLFVRSVFVCLFCICFLDLHLPVCFAFCLFDCLFIALNLFVCFKFVSLICVCLLALYLFVRSVFS